MTIAVPAVTFPGAGTGRDITGRPPASGLLVVMAGPVAPAPGPGSQPVPPRWSKDRSGLWLRHAAAGLCLLARVSNDHAPRQGVSPGRDVFTGLLAPMT
jgi:hypothetical protein